MRILLLFWYTVVSILSVLFIMSHCFAAFQLPEGLEILNDEEFREILFLRDPVDSELVIQFPVAENRDVFKTFYVTGIELWEESSLHGNIKSLPEDLRPFFKSESRSRQWPLKMQDFSLDQLEQMTASLDMYQKYQGPRPQYEKQIKRKRIRSMEDLVLTSGIHDRPSLEGIVFSQIIPIDENGLLGMRRITLKVKLSLFPKKEREKRRRLEKKFSPPIFSEVVMPARFPSLY